MTKPPTGTCERCNARPAESWWSGEADLMAVNHGAPVYRWCNLCCVEEELAHCRKMAAKIPGLEAQRLELLAKTKPRT